MKNTDESVIATWVFIFILTSIFAITSLLAYTVIGDVGQPTWRYGIVPDVPAESPYAVYPKVPYPQHVKGPKGE
jgi:hypothetical protein